MPDAPRITYVRPEDAELRIAATAFHTHLGMIITDPQCRILKVSETFSRMTGYAEEDVLGKHPRTLSAGRHGDDFYAALWQSVNRQGYWEGELWNRRKSGEVYPQWATLSAVHDESGELTHYVATLSDMSERKGAGRNTLAFFDPRMQAKLVKRARLEADLRHALANDEWRLYYQPQVNAAGELNGVEALLRWAHPERGLISPGEFIPLLEDSRMINEVGAWVLENACAQLMVWQDDPRTAAWEMAVNISPVQFVEADFVPRVEAILQRTGAPASRLKLEMTETLFVEAEDKTREKMQHLRELGLRFSLDDFGTGYSSLAYLAYLPLDQLKIDQSFVRELPESETNGAIVESIIALAGSLGLGVIAEGVETHAQHEWLAARHCCAYQGYLFDRPLPVAELEACWRGA